MNKSMLFLCMFMIVFLVKAQEDIFDLSRQGNVKEIEIMLKSKKVKVDTLNYKGFSPLILAVYNGQLDTVDFLLKHKANPNIQDKSGNTALMGACFKGYLQGIRLLMDQGADINIKNYGGATALIYAATFGHKDIVVELLRYGADPTIQDDRGNTAENHARMQGNQEILEVLLPIIEKAEN